MARGILSCSNMLVSLCAVCCCLLLLSFQLCKALPRPDLTACQASEPLAPVLAAHREVLPATLLLGLPSWRVKCLSPSSNTSPWASLQNWLTL